MREIISSSQNKMIKYMKALHAKKGRDESCQFFIEGYKLIEEALNHSRPFTFLLMSETAFKTSEGQQLLKKAEALNISMSVAEDKVFAEASEMDTPQGVLAVLNKQEQELRHIITQKSYNIIILDEVRDPGNVGTIIRTADACGLSAVVLSKGCVDLYNSKTIRATMGSMFHIPIITEVDTMVLIEQLKQQGAAVLGADPHSSTSCIEAKKQDQMAIIIGNESKGLRQEVKAFTTQNITIPMPGQAESLNAGVAAAILMYEFVVRKSKQ